MSLQFAVAAVILAAGKGKRMNMQESNKVTAPLGNKPIINHIVSFMKNLPIEQVYVVVGHAKESVMNALKDESVNFVEQKEQLGTGDALLCAVNVLPSRITDIFVVYGDDAVFYNKKHLPIIEKLFAKHFSENPAITFLTIEQDNPTGLGRIVRDEHDNVVSIVEEKEATDEQKKITEINPGSFLFHVSFLKKYLPMMKRSPTTGEYYLTSLIDIALHHGEKVRTVKGGKLAWRGVNTPEELQEANKLFQQL